MQNEIVEIIDSQLDRLLSKGVSRDLLIEVEERGKPAAELWSEIEDIGVPLVLVSEEQGGAGLSWVEVEPVLRTIGRHAAPVPLGETLIAAGLLSGSDMSVPEGGIGVAGDVFTLNPDGTISGSESSLAWATQTPHVLVAARRDGETFLALLTIEGVSLRTQHGYARIPTAALMVEGVQPLQLARCDSLGELGLLPYLATLRSVLSAGLLDHILALCLDYANTREQFGRPIGKFQAIQHQLAELAGQVAATQVAGLYACRRIDANDADSGAAVAKIRSGMAATRATAIAHQVMGAIGFTDEHILHHYTRRLWQWRGEAGSDHFWAERLGRTVIADGGESLWPSITGSAGLGVVGAE